MSGSTPLTGLTSAGTGTTSTGITGTAILSITTSAMCGATGNRCTCSSSRSTQNKTSIITNEGGGSGEASGIVGGGNTLIMICRRKIIRTIGIPSYIIFCLAIFFCCNNRTLPTTTFLTTITNNSIPNPSCSGADFTTSPNFIISRRGTPVSTPGAVLTGAGAAAGTPLPTAASTAVFIRAAITLRGALIVPTPPDEQWLPSVHSTQLLSPSAQYVKSSFSEQSEGDESFWLMSEPGFSRLSDYQDYLIKDF